jgi:lysozyme family protein
MNNIEIGGFIVDAFEAGNPPGRVTNDKDDAGGITRWGITRGYVAIFRRCKVEDVHPDVIRNLTRDDAIEMLVEVSIMRNSVWRIPDAHLRLTIADFCFNAGDDDGIPALQRAVGVHPDGVIGNETVAAVEATNPAFAIMRVSAARVKFHAERSGHGAVCKTCGLPSQKKWLGGWANRAAHVLETAAA